MSRLLSILCIIALLPVLTGCMLAAAGGTGYYIGTNDRSAGTILDDGVITSEVNWKLINDPTLSALDINVDTDRGVVTLRGIADNSDVPRAIKLAQSIQGVTKVINKLRAY